MHCADGTPVTILGRPVEFYPEYQLGALESAVARFLDTGTATDHRYLVDAHRRVRWYQRAATVSEAVREAARYEALP